MSLIDLDELFQPVSVAQEAPPPSPITINVADNVAITQQVVFDSAKEAAEERAAILEFDGGLSRAEAETRNGIVRCMQCKHWDHLEPAARTRYSCRVNAAEPWLIWEYGQIPVVLAVCDKREKIS